ncbi:hypothetical protein BGZ65_001710 [Modicella reniformis]|uniref:EXS domain-containing protein n=1 Tax=Modicella reniformis TaxID=1440133 RepID=A0A9P6M302_9FUNG|nr:hypothetical protein BGZ65_001710 [Modicella reniformis]
MVLINMWMYKWVVAGSEAMGQRSTGGRAGSATSTARDIRGGMGLTGNPRAGIMVPVVGYLTVLLVIFLPFNIFFKKERYRLLRSMKKALFSGFKSEVTFADVILADILTSFARVFGDLAVALCLMFLDRDGTDGDGCYGSILVPIMTSIPYGIRLRQCISEYIESNYTTERHLMNALKYASAFPVIIISAMQKSSKAASLKGLQYDGYFTDNSLFRLWLFFVALNSFYSFYWDIYHDWSLVQTYPAGRVPTLTVSTSPSATASSNAGVHSRGSSGPMSPATPKNGAISMNDLSNHTNGGSGASSNSPSTNSSGKPLLCSSSSGGPLGSLISGSNLGSSSNVSGSSSLAYPKKQRRFGMRSFLHYVDPLFYIMAVVLDFLLRTTWMLKLVSNIQIEEYEGGVFTMECLEVLRRWIWVLFRLESEMVKRAGYMDTMSTPLSTAGHSGGIVGDVGEDGADNANMILMEDLESWQNQELMDNNTASSPTAVPASQPIAAVTAAFIILGVTIGSVLLHLVLSFIFKRIAQKTIWQFDDDIVKHCKRPTSIMFPTVSLLITIQLLTLPVGVYASLNHVLIIILLFTISYLVVMLIKCASMAVSRSNSDLKDSQSKRSREVETQIIVMTRIIQGMVWILGLAGIAMTFPNAWQVGISLLASASVSALLLGFAAKTSIENALASLTIALTQPFLIEDQVQVNGEVGHIEEIQSQYVIIFQNWSRNSPRQIGECKIFVDYTLSVPRVRQAFLKFARAHPLYDGRHCALLVTDCSSSTIELTCQISVANAMDVIQVTSDVREAMVEFIAKGRHQVNEEGTGSLHSRPRDTGEGSGNEQCRSESPSLPPLTKEDEKLGEGSKRYQTCSSIRGKEAPRSAEKTAVAIATAGNLQPDYIRVNVEEPSPNRDGVTKSDVPGQDATANAAVPATSDARVSEK